MSKAATEPAKAPDPKLDAGSIPEGPLAEAPFPVPIKREFRIHFAPDVHDTVLRHAAETVEVELCGVLLGALKRDRQGPYLAITGSIRGEFAQNDGAQVKFTHQTWDHIHKVKEERYPKESIVGWYHTHPGFGIFLSSMDTFIHEYFFNTAGQVALVVDPRSGEEGVFVWEEGAVARAARFWIGERERRCPAGPVGSPPASRGATAGTPAAATAAAPGASQDPSDELDLLKWAGDALHRFAPVLIGLAIGFVAARLLLPLEVSMLKQDVLRAELRDMVGDAAQAWSVGDDLKRVEDKVSALAARTAGSGTASVGSSELAALHSQLAALRTAADQRQVLLSQAVARRAVRGLSIEDELRGVAGDAAAARQLALEATVELTRLQVQMLSVNGKLGQEEAAVLRSKIDRILTLVPSEHTRDVVRRAFPELYAAEPAKPPSLPAPGPAGPPPPPGSGG